jgi:sugar lactone lactonase YvrE
MLFAAALLTAGCAGAVKVDPFGRQGMVWPEPPNTGRIAHVVSFSRASDLGIKKSAWERLVSFVAGSRDEGMVRPMAVATSRDGQTIFVADPDAKCVHRYDLGSSGYRCLTPDIQAQPVFPVALTITDDGWLYVSDSLSSALYQAAPGSNELQPFYLSSPLERPTGLTWDRDSDLLYVTDTVGQAVKVFDRQGNLRFAIGERGTEPGQFNYPTYTWLDLNGDLLVTDSLNFRVQRLARQGGEIGAFGSSGDLPGDFSRPKGIAVDSYGHIYVIDALMHAMQIFNASGDLLLAIGGRGQEAGEFWLPNGIFINSEDLIYVADSRNKRVQVFRYIGPAT